MKVRAGVVMAMIVSFMFLPTFEADATHIVGGQISYNVYNLGGQYYMDIELIVRRDCELGDPEADFDDPAYIGVYDLSTSPQLVRDRRYIVTANNSGLIEIPFMGADTLDENLTNPCNVMDSLVCVQEATYRTTVEINDFHPSGGYHLAYQRCCRNNSLTNLVAPSDEQGMTLETVITNGSITKQNASPILPAFPPIYACVGIPFDVPQAGVDPDGDQLRYRLNTPNLGATVTNPFPTGPTTPPPYNPIVWDVNYSQGDMMGTNPNPLTIDPNTGLINVTPLAIGQYLVSFCVEEIDSAGRVTNTTCREFEVNTRACGDPAAAVLSPEDITICDNLDVEFSSAGSVGDTLIYDFGDGSAKVIDPTDPITHTFPSEGTYCVTLTAVNANGCIDVDSAKVTLKSSLVIENDFEIEMQECIDTIVVKITDQNVYDTLNPIVGQSWEVKEGGDVIASGTGMMITFGLEDNAEVEICLTTDLENGCEVVQCETVTLNKLELDFDDDVLICLNEETEILISHLQGDSISVVWEDNPIIISDLDVNPATVLTADSLSTTLYFTATNEYGCSRMDSVMITTAGERPGISFFVTQECGSLEIQIENTSPDSFPIMWDFGDGMGTSDEWNPSYEYNTAGAYTITATAGIEPCDTSVSVTIDVPIVTVELPDTVYQCFDEEITLNPGGNADWVYDWSPNELFTDTSAVSPTILVDTITEVYVTITVFDGDNFCVHNDTIIVFPVPDFQFDVDPADDVTVCGEDDNITMSVETMDGVEVTWKDINGMELGQGDTFNVTLNDGLNQFIVMGVYMGIDECMKSDTINVTLNQIELSFDIINLNDGTDMFCEPAPGKLIVNVDGPPGNYEYQWEPSTGVTGSTTSDTLCMDVSGDITYCVTVTNTDLDCSVDGCYTIEFGADVVATLLDDDGVICVGDKVTLVATIDPQGADCSYNWIVPGDIIGSSNGDTICYTATTTGDVIVSVGCVGGCTSSDTVTVEVRDLSSIISISVDPDVVEFDGQRVDLDVINGEDTWTYLWDGPEIDNPNIKMTFATPDRGEHDFSVMVTDEFGCEGTATERTMPPTENPCEHPFVFVPTAFSPNNDGADDRNETVQVFGVEIDIINEFVIYNRWGQEVYRVNNGGPGSVNWDGTYQGDLLEPDVYGYYLRATCENGDESIQQGNITLFR